MKTAINSTKDYEMFKLYAFNRIVDQAKVNTLKKSILEKNLLAVRPIIVDRNMGVIDGQYRLEAAKQLGLEIYYITHENLNAADIALLNSCATNWNPLHYLHFWCKASDKEVVSKYMIIKRYVDKHPYLSVTACLILLRGNGVNHHHILHDFKHGVIDIENVNGANRILGYLSDLFSYGGESRRFVYSNSFIKIFMPIAMSKDYSHKHMMERMKIRSKAFVQCVTSKQYAEMIQEIYNYKVRGEGRKRFVIEDLEEQL